jgi:O-antigen/teichoic acid export membrane protein
VHLAGGKLLSLSALLLAARLLGAAAGFLVQLLLARWLSAGSLGVYYAATSLAVLGGVAAAHGYPSITTRFVSRYRKPSGASLLRAFVRLAQTETMLLALAITASIVIVAAAGPWLQDEARVAVILSAITIPFVAAFRIYGSLALATRAFTLAYLPDVCLKPLFLLAGVCGLLMSGYGISLSVVLVWLAVATVVLSTAQYLLLRRDFPVSLSLWWPSRLPRPRAARKLRARWRREAHAVLLVAVFSQLFPELAILVATPFLSASEIGVYGLCLKLAFLAGFFVLLTQTIATPDLADALAKQSERVRSAKHSTPSTLAAAAMLVGMIVCTLFGARLLGVFGPEFAAGHMALVLLMGAQLVRALFGPTNAVLTLVGERRLNLQLTAASLLVLFLSTATLGARFGLDGAALGVLLTLLVWSAASAYALYRRTGLRVDLLAGYRA